MQPGKNIAAGISSASQSIASGIEKYGAMRERDTIIRGKVEAVVGEKMKQGGADSWFNKQSEDTQRLLVKFQSGKESHDDLLKLGSYIDASETLDAKAREEELRAVQLAHARQQVAIGEQNISDYKATGLALTAAAGARGNSTTSELRSPISPEQANAAISNYYSGESDIAPRPGVDISALTKYNAEGAAYRQEQSQPPMRIRNPAYDDKNVIYETNLKDGMDSLSRYRGDLEAANKLNVKQTPEMTVPPLYAGDFGTVTGQEPYAETGLEVAKRVAAATSARRSAEVGIAEAKAKLAALTPPEKFVPMEKTLTAPSDPKLSAVVGAKTESVAPTNADRQVSALKALSAAGHSVTPGILKALKENYPDETVSMLPVADTGAVVIMQDGKIAGVTAATKAGGEARMQQYQATAQIFADEMAQAEGVVQKLEAQGYNPTSNAWDRMSPTLLNSADGKRYKPAVDKWIEAVLRQRSGAAISKDEYIKAEKQYFPSYGDTKEVIEQKRAMRSVATTAMQAAVLGVRQPVYDANGQPASVYKSPTQASNAPDFIFQNGKMVKNPSK